jgi:hypothetical protein
LAKPLHIFSNKYYPVSSEQYSKIPKFGDLKLVASALNSASFICNQLKSWSRDDWYIRLNLSIFNDIVQSYSNLVDACIQAVTDEFLAELKSRYYPYKNKKDFSFDVKTVSNELLGCLSFAGEMNGLLKLVKPDERSRILNTVLRKFDEYVVVKCTGLVVKDGGVALEQIHRDFLAFCKVLNVFGQSVMPNLFRHFPQNS